MIELVLVIQFVGVEVQVVMGFEILWDMLMMLCYFVVVCDRQNVFFCIGCKLCEEVGGVGCCCGEVCCGCYCVCGVVVGDDVMFVQWQLVCVVVSEWCFFGKWCVWFGFVEVCGFDDFVFDLDGVGFFGYGFDDEIEQVKVVIGIFEMGVWFDCCWYF